MSTVVSRLLLGWVVLALAGCATTPITNVTPRQCVRTPQGLCLVEARWDAEGFNVKKDSIQAQVMVGLDFYPMQRVPKTVNRWEAFVPVPADQRFLNYRYKFDYEYNTRLRRTYDSKLSPTYQLEVLP
ncbi:MAG: hypothetical protein FJ387_00645 [Verrucomicrobia bacterium]|nr:hypothetical protein [Verrucomicrobiota bacterium]